MVFPAEANWCMRLQLVRTMKKQSQQEVADIVGTCRKQIYRWETGQARPNGFSQKKLSQWAGVPKEVLFKGLK